MALEVHHDKDQKDVILSLQEQNEELKKMITELKTKTSDLQLMVANLYVTRKADVNEVYISREEIIRLIKNYDKSTPPPDYNSCSNRGISV
jgi:hypothetical protein